MFDHFVLDTFDAPLINVPDAPTEAARVVPTVAVATPSAEAGAGNFVNGKLCE